MKKQFKLLALLPAFSLTSCDKELVYEEAIKQTYDMQLKIDDEGFTFPNTCTYHFENEDPNRNVSIMLDANFNVKRGSRYFYVKRISNTPKYDNNYCLYEKNKRYFKCDLSDQDNIKEFSTEEEFAKVFDNALKSVDLDIPSLKEKSLWYLEFIKYNYPDAKQTSSNSNLTYDAKFVKKSDSSFRFEYEGNETSSNDISTESQLLMEFDDYLPKTFNTDFVYKSSKNTIETKSVETFVWNKVDYNLPKTAI